MKTAVRDNNPVLVLEAELLYSSKGMVEPPDEELLIPLGKAEVKREGSDVTIFATRRPFRSRSKSRLRLEEEDISAEIVDLRSIKPLDEKAIFDSVAKTHRVVIVEQDHPFCGVGAEICYRIQKNIFDELDAPVIRVSQEDVPMPYNEHLEHAVLPNAEKLDRCRETGLLRVKRSTVGQLVVTLTPNSMPEIQMPKLSDTMTEGTLVAWKKKKGDQVRPAKCSRRSRQTRRPWNGSRPKTERSPKFMSRKAAR